METLIYINSETPKRHYFFSVEENKNVYVSNQEDDLQIDFLPNTIKNLIFNSKNDEYKIENLIMSNLPHSIEKIEFANMICKIDHLPPNLKSISINYNPHMIKQLIKFLPKNFKEFKIQIIKNTYHNFDFIPENFNHLIIFGLNNCGISNFPKNINKLTLQNKITFNNYYDIHVNHLVIDGIVDIKKFKFNICEFKYKTFLSKNKLSDFYQKMTKLFEYNYKINQLIISFDNYKNIINDNIKIKIKKLILYTTETLNYDDLKVDIEEIHIVKQNIKLIDIVDSIFIDNFKLIESKNNFFIYQKKID